MSNQVKEILVKTAQGLLYPSESDYPFEYTAWDTEAKKLTKKLVRQFAGKSSAEPVKTQSLDEFFSNVTEIKDWYGEEEKATAAQFSQLKETLQGILKDIQVFKVGEIEITVFIMGKTTEGTCAGLSTKVIET